MVTTPAQNDLRESGWLAALELEISARNGRSVVSKSQQSGPLTIQRPFYPEPVVCHLYLLHPPAGIGGGDRLQLSVTARQQGAALITTPGATKFYRTNQKEAGQIQRFTIAEGTSIEWLPQETIYFPNARAEVKTHVYLEGNGSFIGWEMHCLGLPVNKLDFADGSARVGLQVFRGGKPLLLESLVITPEKRLLPAAFLRGQPVFGTFIATGTGQPALELLRERLKPTIKGYWAATLLDELLVVRYLGPSISEIKTLFIAAWQILRPHLLGRKGVAPRIWAT